MAKRAGPQQLAAVLVFVLLVPVAAISGGSLATRAQDKSTITMWLDSTSGSETAECRIAAAVDPFNAQSDSVMVEPRLQPNRWQATQTALAAGEGPDVVYTPGPAFATQVTEAGQFLPLDAYAEQYGWNERFAPWALDLGKSDGVLYNIPNQVETLALFYNQTLFEENGWQPPTTIDELAALSEEIAAAGIIPFAHANQEFRDANEWFIGEYLNHVAGPENVYAALTGEKPWTDPEFVDAISALNEAQQNGWFMGGVDRYYTTTFADANAALAAGEAAMKIEGSWTVADLNTFFGESGSEWGWVPMPSTSGDAIYDLGIGSTVSINANAENPDAVAEFIDYLFTPETQARLVVECGDSPASVPLEEDALAGIDPQYAEILVAQNEASAAGGYGYTVWTFFPPETRTHMIENIERLWSGGMTVEEYLQDVQTTFDQEVADGAVPPIPNRSLTG
ncbi:MAG: extracellular solute-binding protein [Chloroflexia bacterium]|nr:extracellular solute-binding protein [Chloroflexia bacterium]